MDKIQEDRLGREQRLLAVVAVALAFFNGISNWFLVFLCIVLLVIVHIRKNAVNTKRQEFAKKRLSITNPFLVFGSLLIIFYLVTLGVTTISYSTTLIGDVVMFSTICLLLGLGILVVEHFSNSEYFDWWSNRALNRAGRKDEEFWVWIAGIFRSLSPRETNKKKY